MISNKIVFHPLFFVTLISLLLFWACSKPTKHHFDPQPPQESNYDDGGPSWSPDGRYIAYEHHGIDNDQWFRHGSYSIWVYDLQLHRYGFLVGPAFNPRWSPDGSILAFRWGHEIYFYYMATGAVRQVTNLGREIYLFRWSGNGQYICADYGHFWLIDSTGTIVRTIQPFDGVITGWAAGSDANWTASCDSILTLGGFVANTWGIYIIDSLGNLIHTILTRQLYTESIHYLAWSPRRNKFAADYDASINGHSYSDLRIYRIDGTLDRIISVDAGQGEWSPDGTWLVFRKYTFMGDNPNPYVIDYGRVTLWVCDSHGHMMKELLGWPQQGYDSTMFGGGYNWYTDTHNP